MASSAPALRVAVAFSGGADSTALLHCTCRLARQLGLEVAALHVNHRLQAVADQWERSLRRKVGRWARAGLPVSFHTVRLDARPAPGDSLEAWARVQRYAALDALARTLRCELVLLAHHERDQAETLVLQALRKGGVSALSGMAPQWDGDGLVWARPWLSSSKRAVDAYAASFGIRGLADPMNSDDRFARSRLRNHVWPAIEQAFPRGEAALAGAATRLRVDSLALDALARRALAHCEQGDALLHADWMQEPDPVREVLLRLWLARRGVAPVPGTLVRRVLREGPRVAAATWPLPQGHLRLYRGRYLVQAGSLPEHTAGRRPQDVSIDLSKEGLHPVPSWGGHWCVRRVELGGAPASALSAATMRARVPGLSFQMAVGRPPRSLKRQYQAGAIGTPDRDAPLLFVDDQLAFIPHLGFDARWLARQQGSPGPCVSLSWEPALAT